MLVTAMFAVVFAVATLFTAQTANAATKTWEGAENATLATASNWKDDTAPQSGDILVFPHDSKATNNLAANIAIAGISVEGSGESYTALEINGSGVLNLRGSISGVVFKQVVFNSPVNITDTTTFDTVDGTLVLNGPLSGEGGLVVNGGTLNLGSDNSQFTGKMTISGEYSGLNVGGHSNAMGSSIEGTTIANGASLWFSIYGLSEKNYIINEPITFTAPVRTDSIFSTYRCGYGDCSTEADLLTLGGVLTIPSAAKATINADTKITKAIAGGGSLQKAAGSSASLEIAGEQSELQTEIVTVSDVNNCPYSVDPGYTYIIAVDCTKNEYITTVYVNKSGILKGTGSMKGVTLRGGGTIAPGNSPGVISTGDLAFEKGGIYEFEMAGDEVGKYDQINVTGTVKLGNGTLKTILLDKFTPGQGKTYVIINNDGTDAVEGTFLGLAEGATVNLGDRGYFTISYKGGDGNDVVLTTLPGVGKAGDENGIPQAAILITGFSGAAGLSVLAKRGRQMVKR